MQEFPKRPDVLVTADCPVSHALIKFQFDNLSALMEPDKRFVNSAKIEVGGAKWWLEIYPQGVSAGSDDVGCYVRHDSYLPQKVSFSIGLKHIYFYEDNDFEHANWLKVASTVIECNQRMGSDEFINIEEFRSWYSYRFGEFANFYLGVTVIGDTQATITVNSPTADSSTAQTPFKRRRIDTAPLLLDPTYSDMTLVVQGERIPAHKCLLCPRSSVFRAMFQHPMQEAASNEVQVGEGFEAPAVKAMLSFLYTDTIPEQDLSQQAARLMDLAVYYQMDDLKEYAESHLLCNLTAENVGEALQLGQLHGCKQIVARAQQFITANAKALIARPDFLASLDLESSHKMLKALAGVADRDEVEEIVGSK